MRRRRSCKASSKGSDMSDWRRGRLGDLAKGHRGVTYAAGDLCQQAGRDTVVLLRSNNISEGRLNYTNIQIVPERLVSEAQVLKVGDIAVCMSNGSKALVGKSAPLLEQDADRLTVGAFCSVFKPIEGADARFASYAFQSNEYRKNLDFSLAGTAINNLRNRDLESFPCDIPPPDEQMVIGRVLLSLDTTIHETEAIIAKLKAVKQGLLHDLLTRGIDANGELRPPQAEAPHLYKQSPLGWTPKDWQVVRTAQQCSLITKGTTPSAERMWRGGEGVRFLRVDNLSFDGGIDTNASNFRVSRETHSGELSRSICFPGDVLTNIVGPPLGKLGLVTPEHGEVNINQAIAVFRPKSDLLLSDFLLLYLGSLQSQGWLRSRAKQTSGQLNLTLALCQELPIPEIPIEQQRLIVESLDGTRSRITSEITALEKLHQVKCGLMEDLLTGRIRVKKLLSPEQQVQAGST